MTRLLSRLGWSLFTIWAVVSLTFFINHALPADPARVIAGPQARPAEVAKIRERLGLNRPILVQYEIFWHDLVHLAPRGQHGAHDALRAGTAPGLDHTSCATLGPLHVDLGTSYQKGRPVVAIIADRLPRTIGLGLAAMFVEIVIGVSTGVFASVRRNTAWDYGTVTMTLVGISAPTFLIGMVLQYVLAYRLRILPLDGFGRTFGEHLLCVILPALTLGVFGAAYYTRLVRDEMIGLLKQDFVRTARSKGVGAIGVVVRHALRNALVPLVTVIGLELGTMVGGAIVTEKLFRWPGLGQLSVDAVFDRDGPVIMGTVIVASTAIVIANLLVDLSYALLDPRARTNR